MTIPPIDRAALIQTLDRLCIAHETHNHAPIFTVEDGADIKAAMPGGHTKNLFLKDKTGALFLICALGDTALPINKLHKVLDCKRLSFGKPELLLAHLGVTPGSVTFFSIINDIDNQVQLVLDKALFEHEIVNFHPLKNDATTAIAAQDLLRFAAHTGHSPITIDFKALHEASDTPS